MAGKNVLIVYAHQEPSSFNNALKDAAVDTLTSQGHSVTVSDLYQMGFNPVTSRDRFKEFKNPEHFDFEQELSYAVKTNTLPDTVAKEIRNIQDADLIILQFPLYWFQVPAIVKGWMEWCFAEDVAYTKIPEKGIYGQLFLGKKMMLSITTGGHASAFTNKGKVGNMEDHLWSMQFPFAFCGFQVLSSQINYAVKQVSPEAREEMLRRWIKRLENIFTETPLPFLHLQDFEGPKREPVDEYVKHVEDNKEAPTARQNIGKPLPTDQAEISSDNK